MTSLIHIKMGLCTQQEERMNNLHRKLMGETPMVYEFTAAAAAWIGAASAAVGTAYTISASEKAKKKAAAAAAEQKALQDKAEARLAEEEKAREQRMGRARQGRRSLLYKEGDEAGVDTSTTLGG